MNELGTRILNEHREREELLLLHQESLIEQDLPEALARYATFHDCLRAHIELENRELLPRHEQVVQPRWRTQVYALEHDKILELAEKLHERLRQAVAAGDAVAVATTGAGVHDVTAAGTAAHAATGAGPAVHAAAKPGAAAHAATGTAAGAASAIAPGAGTMLDAAPGQARRRWIIQLLDDDRTLKNVLEHHEEREEKGMLPELGLAPFPED